ncbi:MAG: DNA topoisomerase, partial [Candidatus Aenigmatarchaeota archaeon]
MPTIIIAEKPDAARRIAEALAEKNFKAYTDENKVTYYEFERNGKKHIVVCAVGHLFNLAPLEKSWKYPIFNYTWKPSFEVNKQSAFSKKYFDVVKKMVEKGSDFIIATDYDTEGELIGANILRFLANRNDAKRMKFSALTKDELIESYEKVLPHLDFGQLEAGLTRHELDWLWGINITRALTLALKNSAEKGFAILSSGRVQSPTLAILLDRELEIRKFKPKPFWELELHVKINGTEAVASYEKGRIWKKEEADKILQECKGKDAKVKDIKKKKYKQAPPVPFNTTDLQAEAYQQFKFSPQQTMNIAESLYQQGFISYPRSASQKLPASVNYEKILKALASLPQYKKFAEELLKKEKLVPVEGKKEDPAHPCFPADASFSLNPHSYMSFKDLTKFVKSWEWDEIKGSYFGKLSKPIKVLAFDSKNNKILSSFVSGCWKTPFNKTLIKITTKSGNSIELTGNHPIMTLDATKGICFKEARELRAGDILLSKVKEDPVENEKVIITEEGLIVSIPSDLTFEEIREIKIGRKVDYVYDLEVEKYHTFFVNNFLVHNCVYATHEVPDLSKLTPQERKIYDLIARRTLAAFGDEALRETNTVSLDVAGHTFLLVGKRTLEPGWTKIYEPYLKREEIILPELKIGQTIKV